MLQYTRSPEQQFKREEATIGWSWRLFVFAVIAFCTSGFLYGGVAFGYQRYLNDEIEKLEEESKRLNEAVSVEDQRRLVAFYSQVYNLKSVLNNHTFPSKLFAFLEANTNVRVQFDKATFDNNAGTLVLDGKAEDYASVVRQAEAFRQRSEVVTSVALTGSRNEIDGARSVGPVTFSLKLTLQKQFFKQ